MADASERCTLYIVRRTQIYLDDEQARRLDEHAAEAGTTRSAVIRDAIDAHLRRGGTRWAEDWQQALKATSGIAPYLAEDHVESMRAAGARRLDELEPRRE